jgi:acetyl-CoA carboxylase biotin carboxyl carrier protein
MDIDLKQLKELMRSLKQFDISELELEKDGERIKLCRTLEGVSQHVISAPPVHSLAPSVTPPAGAPSVAPPAGDEGAFFFVTSPFVGTFYASKTPGAEPFVKVGSQIKPGQVLCIVEAMKLMNEIEAEAAGTIVEVKKS